MYVMHGWLCCALVWLHWRRRVIGALSASSVAAWEVTRSVCGAQWGGLIPSGPGGLCDKGLGVPLTYLLLALACLAVVGATSKDE